MFSPFQVVREFELALCEYTGAPFAVTTTSCTDAIKLAVAYHLHVEREIAIGADRLIHHPARPEVQIPKRTYVGVPMAIIHAGGRPTFRDQDWVGYYELAPLRVYDSARWFSASMYREINAQDEQIRQHRGGIAGLHKPFVCVSFHWAKTLGIQQGGAILHDDPRADHWLRMARFDGRQEGVHPKDQKEWIIGHHCYLAPETAAAGLVRLLNIPTHNEPLPWGPGTDSDYPDLSALDIFK